MKMSFADLLDQDRRLVVLRALSASAQYRANAFLLRRYCQALGHTVSADRTEADIAWLAEQGLLSREQTQEVTIATLTVRGLDVATGQATCPGVTQPQPGA